MAGVGFEAKNVKALSTPPSTGDLRQSWLVAANLTAPAICVICLERIDDEVILVPCKHDQFHFVCIGTWLQHNKICPLCKAEVKAVSYGENGKRVSYHLPESHRGPTSPHSESRHPSRRFRRPRWSDSEFTPREELQESALAFRKQVYQDRAFSMYIGNNKHSGYRNVTPEVIRGDERLVLKAKKWIRRELCAFEFLNPNSSSFGCADRRATNAEYLLDYILAIIKSIDMRGSAGQAQELLSDYLGRRNSTLFLHELENWLRSPFEDLKDWDASIQYKKPPEG